MEQVDCLVIGAGVVGLAVARELAMSGRDVIVLEAADAIGTGTSSRNSEVIHAGIYYPAGSLKALGLKSIDTQDSATRIVIGGSVDNTVGILLAGASGAPAINPSSYIWIEDLGDGWFLFRTT